MRIFISIIIIQLFFSQKGFTQFLFGPLGGVQATQIKFGPLYAGESFGVEPKLSFKAGGVLNYSFGKNVSLHSELTYAQTGKKLTSSLDENFKNKATYNFLEVPLLLRFNFNTKMPGTQWYVNLGPHIDYWLSGKGKITASQPAGRGGTYDSKYKIRFGNGGVEEGVLFVSDANRWQFGLDIGGGVILPIQAQKLMLDVRLSYGTTYMGKGESSSIGFTEFSDNFEYTNNILSVSAAYLFELDIWDIRRGKSRSKK
jgi:opacity protein-like surface antigen